MTRRALALLLLSLACVACARTSAPPSGEGSPTLLVGAGATLPYPLYSRWAADYASVDRAVRINYQSIGSGAGIRQVSDGVVDFGATDEPMTSEQLRHSTTKLVHVPTTVGGVVFAFNLPGERDLALTAELAAGIFMGTVERWDDERIRAVNAGRALPAERIIVVHRADGSGTSAALTSYLAKYDARWHDTVGSGTSPRFPVGVGAKGNEGVAAFVRATPFAIGYVELVYARQSGLAMARVKNRAGRFVAPSVDGLERAAMSAALPTIAETSTDETHAGEPRFALEDAEDPAAYPIAAVSFVVLPRDARDRAKAEALAKFLWWAVHDGQALSRGLDYAPLAPSLVVRAERALHDLRADGHPLLPAGG